MAFDDIHTLATLDRSWGDRKEELRFERSEFKGKPTYALRIYWQTPDGAWRWSPQKPTAAGKHWASFNLKAAELRELGEAMVQASVTVPTERSGRSGPRKGSPPPAELSDDDIPF